MKRLAILFLLSMISMSSISARDFQLSIGLNFSLPEEYQVIDSKQYPFVAKSGQNYIYIGVSDSFDVDNQTFFNVADTTFFNLNRSAVVKEKKSPIWQIDKKALKRYYKLSDDSYVITYSVKTTKTEGCVIAATYSTDEELQNIENMFSDIRVYCGNPLDGFITTFKNGGWLGFIILMIYAFIVYCITKNKGNSFWGFMLSLLVVGSVSGLFLHTVDHIKGLFWIYIILYMIPGVYSMIAFDSKNSGSSDGSNDGGGDYLGGSGDSPTHIDCSSFM